MKKFTTHTQASQGRGSGDGGGSGSGSGGGSREGDGGRGGFEHADDKMKINVSASGFSPETEHPNLTRLKLSPTQWSSVPTRSKPFDLNDYSIPIVNLPKAQIEHLRAKHEFSLFAKVLGKTVGLDKLSKHLDRLLGPGKVEKITPLENGYFLVKFMSSEGYNRAIRGVPWMIDDHYITLREWEPDFRPSEAFITKTAVWIRLPELPVEYYDEDALTCIAASVGKPVRIHPITESLSRGKFARIAVELDICSPIPGHVELPNGQLQAIQYEGLHVLCYQCGCVGHLRVNCPFGGPVSISLAPSSSNSLAYGPGIQVPPHWSQGFTRSRSPSKNQQEPLPDSRDGTALLLQGSRFRVLEQENPAIDIKDERLKLKAKSVVDQGNVASPNNQYGSDQNQNHQAAEVKPSNFKNKAVSRGKEAVELATTSMKPEQASEISFQPVIIPEYYSPSAPISSSPPCSPLGIKLHSQVVQRLTQEREVKEPSLVIERSTEVRPTIFRIDSKITKLDVDVNIFKTFAGYSNQHHIKFTPTEIDHTVYRSSSPKKILSWNCRGASDPKVIQAIKDLCQLHQPSILLLFDTRTTHIIADQVFGELGFSSSPCIEPVDGSVGVCLLWCKKDIQCIEVNPSSSTIHASIQFPSRMKDTETEDWFIFGVDSDQDSVS